MLKQVIAFLNKHEKIISYLIAIACFLPVFQNRQFLGMDVPAHQHNSFLLNEIIFNANSPLQHYYEINDVIVPNYSGHVVLSFFMLFTQAATANKLMLFFLGLLTFFSFRVLLNAMQPGSQKWSWFVLPLFWNKFVHFGFFNFLFSIPFAFLVIAYVLAYNKNSNKKYLLFIFISLTGLWFSHVSVFFVVCLLVFLISLFKAIQTLYAKSIKSFIWVQVKLLVLFIPFVILTFVYFHHFPSGQYVFISKPELWKMLFEGNALMALTTEELNLIGRIMLCFLILILVAIIYALVKKMYSPINWLTGLSSFVLMVVLYFIMPDADGKGGYMSMRLLLMMYFLIAVFVSVLLYKLEVVKIVLGIFLVVVTIKLAIFKQENVNALDGRAKDVEMFATHMKDYSTVFVFTNCENWLINHFSNYMGINKPLVIYENYECQNVYFPLVWKNNELAKAIVEVSYQNRQLDKAFVEINEKLPDYVLFNSENQEKVAAAKRKFKNLDSLYTLQIVNGMGELYGLKHNKQ